MQTLAWVSNENIAVSTKSGVKKSRNNCLLRRLEELQIFKAISNIALPKKTALDNFTHILMCA